MAKISEEEYWKELKEFEDKYYELISHFNTNFPKAINLQEEKKKFFSAIADDKIYNPQFKFENKNFDEEKLEELKNLKINTKNDLFGFKKLYFKRLKTKLYELECHKNWGKQISTKYVIMYRGKPSRLILSRAKLYCRLYKRKIVKYTIIETKEAAKILKNEVLRLTGENLKIVYGDINSKMNIIPYRHILKINPNEEFKSIEINRLKVHEIGTHFMRYWNGKNMGIKILEHGTSNYIETEEGLAAYMEDLKNVSSRAQKFIYAGRVIATFYALKLSFYDLFILLKEYGFKEEDAFAMCFRAKRNISDTSLKGGFTKDYVYFSGYYKVKRYHRFNNLKNLFLGKINIDDLKILKKFLKLNKNKIKTIIDENNNL